MRRLSFTALALIGALGACTQILGIDGDYGPLGEGGAGLSGQGGAGTGTNTGTNAGTSTGTNTGGPGWENGEECNNDSQCSSGHCVDDVCCETACDGSCVACVMDETGVADGTCAPVPDGVDACPGPNICVNGSCGKGTGGEPCDSDMSCQDTCGAEDVCCESKCDGTCESCLEANTGMADGTCALVTAGTDPLGGCGMGQVCDTGGDCKSESGGACDVNNPNTCLSGFCADGVCCDTACDQTCDGCTMALTGMADGTCAQVTAGTSCGADAVCDATGSCKIVDGAACDINNPGDCLSGLCVDGVCCDTACNQLCEGCTMALSGMADGTCAPIPSGQDPEDECPLTETCDGANMCQP